MMIRTKVRGLVQRWRRRKRSLFRIVRTGGAIGEEKGGRRRGSVRLPSFCCILLSNVDYAIYNPLL